MSKSRIIPFGYNRATVMPGIAHIGTASFDRSVEAFFTNEVLRYPDQRHWGIRAIMTSPAGKQLYKKLSDDNGLYTLTAFAPDGRRNCFEIGSVVSLLYAPDEPEKAIDAIAAPETRIISLSLGPDGYDISTPEAAHDIAHPGQTPQSHFGFIAEALRRRIKGSGRPVTILSCDNLPHNGDTASKAFMKFFGAQDPSLVLWAEEYVTFPNSVIDRFTPAVSSADVRSLNDRNATCDAAPVQTEEYALWVMEDRFADGRPAWERAGATFTDNLEGYEQMKQTFADGAASMLAYPAFLAGMRKASQALNDPHIRAYIEKYLDADAAPHTAIPHTTDAKTCTKAALARLADDHLQRPLSTLAADGALRIPASLLTLIGKMKADPEADLSRVAFLLAAYRHYLHYQTDDNGERFSIDEPHISAADKKLIMSDDPADFLRIGAFAAAGLTSDARFMAAYSAMVQSIKSEGTMATLSRLSEKDAV